MTVADNSNVTTGPTSSVTANTAIAVLHSLPSITGRDHLIAALTLLGDSKDATLARWDAMLADPSRTTVPDEFHPFVTVSTLKRLLEIEIQTREEKKNKKLAVMKNKINEVAWDVVKATIGTILAILLLYGGYLLVRN